MVGTLFILFDPRENGSALVPIEFGAALLLGQTGPVLVVLQGHQLLVFRGKRVHYTTWLSGSFTIWPSGKT
jgi:hypothetical protein